MLLRFNNQPKEALQMKYIGLDAHSKTCFFAVLSKQGKVVRKRREETNEANILTFVRSVGGLEDRQFHPRMKRAALGNLVVDSRRSALETTDALPKNFSFGGSGLIFSLDRLFHRRS